MNIKLGFRRIYYLIQACWTVFLTGLLLYIPWSEAGWKRSNDTQGAWDSHDSCRISAQPTWKDIMKAPEPRHSEMQVLYYGAIAACDVKRTNEVARISAHPYFREALAENFKGFWSASNLL